MKKYLFLLIPIALVISNMYFVQIEANMAVEPDGSNTQSPDKSKNTQDKNEPRMSSSKSIQMVVMPDALSAIEKQAKSGANKNHDEMYMSSSKVIDEIQGPIARGVAAFLILFVICGFIYRGTKILLKRSKKKKENTEEDKED